MREVGTVCPPALRFSLHSPRPSQGLPSTRKGPEGRTQVGGGISSQFYPLTGSQGTLTFRLDFKSCSNQSKQGCIKHDCPITVERHVHGN